MKLSSFQFQPKPICLANQDITDCGLLFEYSIYSGYVSIEPRHGISKNVVCATSKASDQPAHTRSLIRAFASRMNILRTLTTDLTSFRVSKL